ATMAVRSLTEAFILMRNNALQSKNMFASHHSDYEEDGDMVALVGNKKYDEESRIGFRKCLPPQWTDETHDLKYNISKIEEKMADLSLLHDKHLHRPTLDDDVEEEHEIEVMTQEVTHLFHQCSSTIKVIRKKAQNSEQERVIVNNVVSSYASKVQNLSTDFRKAQSSYLKKLKNREERSHHFFSSTSVLMPEHIEDDVDDADFNRALSQDQVAIINQNTVNIDQRESEIRSVVQSINDLAEIFNDLGNIVVEQGTVLDRIDYNVEHAVLKTETGLGELKKAEEYQKKNRKLLVIVVMAVITIILLIILISRKS
uniref:t-SNARE coiled-coil homology domain-containing protein n=1 Tax=Ciona savignyi TaxID=51511 RepID=H2YZ54_CIOSA